MRKRICLISPGHVCANPRLVKEADALSEAGYDVHVVAANDLPGLRAFDAPILASARWSYDLAGGQSAFDKSFRIASRFARALVSYGVQAPLAVELGHHRLALLLRIKAASHKADLYIAHYVGAIPAAFHAARKHRALWGFDAEDFHQGEFEGEEKRSRASRLVATIEQRYLPSAQHFTAASPGIAAAYSRLLQRRPPLTLLNVFPLSQAPDRPTSAGAETPGPSLYWFSQTIGPNRGLECAVAAIAKSKAQPHLYLRGRMQPDFAAKLEALAVEHGAQGRIHVLPLAQSDQMEKLASRHDLGLVAETAHSENRAIALTNKLFTFLLAGLPVLASDIKAHRELARTCEPIRLFANLDSDALAAQIDSLLLDRDALAAARRQAWQEGQSTYNWDREKLKLIDAVSQEIGAPC